MQLTRRDFLRLAGGVVGGTAAASLLAACGAAQPAAEAPKADKDATEGRIGLGMMT